MRVTMLTTTCLTGLLLLAGTPALAGKGDRAQSAIARASGKIDVARHLGTGGDVPGLTARAEEALAAAKEDVRAGAKEHAIFEANHASALADEAMNVSHRMRSDATNAELGSAEAAASDAQDAAANANARANSAEARASSAEQAASDAASAAAAANMPPPPATTHVTVESEHSTTSY